MPVHRGKQTPSIKYGHIQLSGDVLLVRLAAFFGALFLVGLFVVALGFTFDDVSFSTIAAKSSGSTGS